MNESLNSFYMNIPWYKLSPSQRRLLVIVMAQKAKTIKAVMYPMTYARFQKIINTAYSHCVILKDLLTQNSN